MERRRTAPVEPGAVHPKQHGGSVDGKGKGNIRQIGSAGRTVMARSGAEE